MHRFALCGLVLALAVASCKRFGAHTLAANWPPVSAELGGQDFPVANFAGATLRLTDSTYEFACVTGKLVCAVGQAQRGAREVRNRKVLTTKLGAHRRPVGREGVSPETLAACNGKGQHQSAQGETMHCSGRHCWAVATICKAPRGGHE